MAGRWTIFALRLGGGLDDLLLEKAKTSGQRAGAQQHGDAVGLFQGEVAGNLDGAAGDGLADYGEEITLSSSAIAKGIPTFSAVMWAKRRVPRPLKRNEAIGSFVSAVNPGPA